MAFPNLQFDFDTEQHILLELNLLLNSTKIKTISIVFTQGKQRFQPLPSVLLMVVSVMGIWLEKR